jgi:hypothetical protein
VEKAKVGLFIQRAKSLSLATRLRSNLERPCGYGVEVDYVGNTLQLFTYSGNESKPGACATVGDASPSPDLGKDAVETVGLAQGIKLFKSSDSTAVPLEQVFFKAPDPTTFLWVGGSYPKQLSAIPGFAAEVTLQWGGDSSMQEKVRVSNAGEVSF